MSIAESYEELLVRLHRERDELAVRAHLLSLDARDEWQKAEGAWEGVKEKARELGCEGAASYEDIREAMEALLMEISDAYHRMRKILRR